MRSGFEPLGSHIPSENPRMVGPCPKSHIEYCSESLRSSPVDPLVEATIPCDLLSPFVCSTTPWLLVLFYFINICLLIYGCIRFQCDRLGLWLGCSASAEVPRLSCSAACGVLVLHLERTWIPCIGRDNPSCPLRRLSFAAWRIVCLVLVEQRCAVSFVS